MLYSVIVVLMNNVMLLLSVLMMFSVLVVFRLVMSGKVSIMFNVVMLQGGWVRNDLYSSSVGVSVVIRLMKLDSVGKISRLQSRLMVMLINDFIRQCMICGVGVLIVLNSMYVVLMMDIVVVFFDQLVMIYNMQFSRMLMNVFGVLCRVS